MQTRPIRTRSLPLGHALGRAVAAPLALQLVGAAALAWLGGRGVLFPGWPLLLVGWVLLWGGLALGMLWRTAGALGAALRALCDAADELGAATRRGLSRSERVPVFSGRRNELVELQASFAAMRTRVEAAYREVNEFNRRLRAQVRQRTTELRQKNLALAFQNEKVTEVNRLKSAFFANVSHELRTPLNAILALTEMLRDEVPGPLNEAQRKHLGMTYASGEKLLALINEVLDLSRIEAGRMEIRRVETTIVDQLADAAEELRLLAEEKGLGFEVEADGRGARVPADAQRLRQVFVNLLGNAIKFTQQGHVAVRIQLLGEESMLSVEVEDTGPGIPPNEQRRIFFEFHRLEGEGLGSAGTGLGLAISKKLIHLMGGDIWVDSTVGQGSRFAFVVPLQAEDEQELGAEEHEVGAGAPVALDWRILLLERDPVEAGVLRRYLRQRGLSVAIASNGADAGRQLREGGIDLVVANAGFGPCQSHASDEGSTAACAPPLLLYGTRERAAATSAPFPAPEESFFDLEGKTIGDLVAHVEQVATVAAQPAELGGADEEAPRQDAA